VNTHDDGTCLECFYTPLLMMVVSDELREDSILKIYILIQYIIIYVPTPFGNQVCYMCTTTGITSGSVWTNSDVSEESV